MTHLRQAGAGQPAPIRAALPSYLKERGITRQLLAPLTGSDALKPGEFDEGFTVRFLEALTWEADDARGLMWTVEREWHAARTVVFGRLGSRSTSRLPQATDVLTASPLLSVSALGCTVEGASRMLDELAGLEIVGGHRHDRARRPAPVRAQASGFHPWGNNRSAPAPERRTTRARKVLVPPFAQPPVEPQGAPTGSAGEVPEASRLTPLAFDFEALDRLIAATDEQTRHMRRLLTRLANGEPPYTEPETSDPSSGEN